MLSVVNHFNLVIYTDKESFKSLVPLLKNNKNIKIIIKPLQNFNTYKYNEYWIANHQSSTMQLHKITDWELNMLWNEKVFFVLDTVQNKYFDSKFYGWCDIGYFRNGPDDLNTAFLHSWANNNVFLKPPFNYSLIHYGCVQNDKFIFNQLTDDIKGHYAKPNVKLYPPTNKYNEISIAGGFFILTPELASIYAKIYDDKLKYYFDNHYFIKDDQLIVMDIVTTTPHLFCLHREQKLQYNNWFMFQRLLLSAE